MYNNKYAMNAQVAKGLGGQSQDAQQSTGKVSAEDAKYVDQAGSCANCSKFQGDGQPCAVVADPVSAGGWCSLYEAGQPNMDQSKDGDAGMSDAAAAPAMPPASGMSAQ